MPVDSHEMGGRVAGPDNGGVSITPAGQDAAAATRTQQGDRMTL